MSSGQLKEGNSFFQGQIPVMLVRRVKAHAALEGITANEAWERITEAGLRAVEGPMHAVAAEYAKKIREEL